MVMMLDKHKGQGAISELIFIIVFNHNTIDTDLMILCCGRCFEGPFCVGYCGKAFCGFDV